MSSVPVRVRVPAKINLGLSVGPLGTDGYHPLVTLFQAVGLYDDITAELLDERRIELAVTGEGAEALPTDDRNLAYRAAQLILDTDPELAFGVKLTIRKGIPIAGGMAGGSADAAGALLACSVLWDLDLDPDDLIGLAAQLGSDVPFCLLGGNAVGTGRGERLAPALGRGQFHWVVVLADEGLSTPAVYRRFDELGLGAEPALDPELLQALAAGDARRLGAALRNDLQAAAVDLRPELARLIERGTACGAVAGLVSGSGPTVAFLAPDENGAVSLANALSGESVGRAVRRAVGPVPGARLVH